MSDLIYLMSQLVDKDGKILITDIYKSVAPLTENEKKLYTTIDFDTEAYRSVFYCIVIRICNWRR